MATSRHRKEVLILGGGFGGLSCALALPNSRFSVTVVDQKPHFEYLPGIHELVSRRKTPGSLRLPLRAVLAGRGHRFKRGQILAIDPAARQVTTSAGELSYDYLVVALGGVDTDFGIPGVREHAFGFKSVAQCAAIGEALSGLLRAGKPSTVNIVGTGFEGIEAAGEVLRRTRGSAISLNLIDASTRLLPSAPEAVSHHLEALCHDAGVHLLLGESVARVMPKTIALADGRRVRSGLTIWTAGAAPQPLYWESGLTSGAGWIHTDTTLQHPIFEQVFVIGDNAEPDVGLSKQAYHAIDMGGHCAANLQRHSRGRALRSFRASDKPQLISVGELDTLLIHPRACLAGPVLAPLKEAIYQVVMGQLDQRRTPRRLAGVAARGVGLPGSILDLLSDRALAVRAGVRRLA